jgi:hypothetical protein
MRVKNCKSDGSIEKLLQNIQFTFNILEGSIQFANTDKVASPVKTRDAFHSQFQLSLSKYIDNNNFLRINEVERFDEIYGWR